jgi:pimeloyl-ACP methyl ester carboxylesterase
MALAPTARLSFRKQPAGGDVEHEPSEPEYLEVAGRRHLLLLIHGYNNDFKDSLQAYQGFEQLQRELAGLDEAAPVANGRIVQIYWPGDADWGVASPLFYPMSIGRARTTAEALADTLKRAARQGGHKYVDIVAHSMGCRLALELLKQLRDANDITVGRVALMAGAVPTFMLEPESEPDVDLRTAFETMLADAGLSLYSGSDMILALAFPLGQSVAPGKEGFMPTALGREFFGTAPGRLAQEEIPHAGHSDYWGWQRSESALKCARAANGKLRTFLRFDQIGERTCDERETPERGASAERETCAERTIVGRNETEGTDS